MRWPWSRRRAARVILLNGDGRVLLFRLDPGRDPDGLGYWYLPGGGIRPRETPEAAAVRELREETGITGVTLRGVVGRREGVSFTFRGRRVVQDEWYVAGVVPSALVGSARRGEHEHAAVGAHRWWTPADIAATTEVVHPDGLAAMVEVVVAATAAGAVAGADPTRYPAGG